MLGSCDLPRCACWWCLLVSGDRTHSWEGREGSGDALYLFPKLSCCSDPHCPGLAVPNSLAPCKEPSVAVSPLEQWLRPESPGQPSCVAYEGGKLQQLWSSWTHASGTSDTNYRNGSAPLCPFDQIIAISYLCTALYIFRTLACSLSPLNLGRGFCWPLGDGAVSIWSLADQMYKSGS